MESILLDGYGWFARRDTPATHLSFDEGPLRFVLSYRDLCAAGVEVVLIPHFLRFRILFYPGQDESR